MNNSPKEIPAEMHYKCLVCDRKIELEPGVRRTLSAPPNGGVSFSTYGNYGSAVYDFQERTEAVVCDECFVKKAGSMITYDPKQENLMEGEKDFVYVSAIIPKPSWKIRLRSWLMKFLPPFARRYYR